MTKKGEDEFKSSLEAFKKSKLEEVAKIRIKDEILTHVKSPAAPNLVKSPYFNHFKFYHLPKSLILSLVLVVFISIGTAQASRSSLPGDLLYPIKTSITEPIIKSTKLTTTEKVAFDIELADTRIEELETLITKNQTTEKNVTANFVLFEKHISESKKDEEKETPEPSIIEDSKNLSKVSDDKKPEKRAEKKALNAQEKNKEDLEVRIEKYHELVNSVPQLNVFYEKTVKIKLPKKSQPSQVNTEMSGKERESESSNSTEIEIKEKEDAMDIPFNGDVLDQENIATPTLDVTLPIQKINKTPKIGI